jgi:hypothetical protein
MSIQAVAWALSLPVPDPFAKLVLISLSNHADQQTGHCWPTMSFIGKQASCDRRTVMRKLPDLVEAGYVKVFRWNSRGRALDYQVLSPGIVALASPPSRRKTHRKTARYY